MRNNWIYRLIAAGFFIQGIGESLTISARMTTVSDVKDSKLNAYRSRRDFESLTSDANACDP